MENAIYALMPFWNIALSTANFLQKRTINRDDYEQAYKKHTVTDTKTAEMEENLKASKKKMKDYDSRENFNSDKWDEEESHKLFDEYHHNKVMLEDRKKEVNGDNKKSSSSNKSSGLSDKTIKSRVEYAKNTGKFDMEFLERIDRYVDEENHSQAELLKGYEKYLKEHGDEYYKKK